MFRKALSSPLKCCLKALNENRAAPRFWKKFLASSASACAEEMTACAGVTCPTRPKVERISDTSFSAMLVPVIGFCSGTRCLCTGLALAQVLRGASSVGKGTAASIARLARKTRSSDPTAPMICSPIGNPAFVNPQGTDAAGCVVRLKG